MWRADDVTTNAGGGEDRPVPADDHILVFTRVVAAVVVGILFTAWFALYLHPGETDHRFAWTISSRMTAMLMGAGYGSAILFYTRVLFGRRWHRVALGFIPTTVFTWLLLAATVLHWGKFRHGSVPFMLWVWIYAITPILVPAVWLMNRPRDPGSPESEDPPLAAIGVEDAHGTTPGGKATIPKRQANGMAA